MTLVSDIIQRAYRETNLIPLAGSVSANQSTEALNLLNTIILQTFGNEAGDELRDLNVGGGHGEFDESDLLTDWVPDDTRLVLKLDAADTVDADPYPYEGQRLAFVDVGANLATYNYVIDGNGRTIEGAATMTLSTNSDSRQWMYRADTANWVKIASLTTADQMPLSAEFDDYFIIALAMRLNPRYGQTIDTASFTVFQKSKSRIRSRYRPRRRFTPTDPGLLRPEDDLFGYSPDEAFDRGRR